MWSWGMYIDQFISVNSIENIPGDILSVSIDYTQEFPRIVRRHYGRQRCSKKMMIQYLHDAIEEECNKSIKEWDD